MVGDTRPGISFLAVFYTIFKEVDPKLSQFIYTTYEKINEAIDALLLIFLILVLPFYMEDSPFIIQMIVILLQGMRKTTTTAPVVIL